MESNWTAHDKYIEALAKNFETALQLMKSKNADYATESDPFCNFRECERFGVPVEKGILVRMTDKVSRLLNLISKPGQVKDESIQDTLTDLMNYSNILKVYLDTKGEV